MHAEGLNTVGRRVCHSVCADSPTPDPGIPSHAGMRTGEGLPRPVPPLAQHVPPGPYSAPLGSHSRQPALITVSPGGPTAAAHSSTPGGGTIALGGEPHPEKRSPLVPVCTCPCVHVRPGPEPELPASPRARRGALWPGLRTLVLGFPGRAVRGAAAELGGHPAAHGCPWGVSVLCQLRGPNIPRSWPESALGVSVHPVHTHWSCSSLGGPHTPGPCLAFSWCSMPPAVGVP